MKRVIGLVAGIAGALLTAVSGVFLIRLAVALHEVSETESIGIIGGADGPTAVFLASSGVAVTPLVAVAGLIMGIVGIIASAVLLHRKKTDKEK